ncbi:MAG: hypothetical protein P8Z76_19405, partial [Alphaproteobacteria bacterium]
KFYANWSDIPPRPLPTGGARSAACGRVVTPVLVLLRRFVERAAGGRDVLSDPFDRVAGAKGAGKTQDQDRRDDPTKHGTPTLDIDRSSDDPTRSCG